MNWMRPAAKTGGLTHLYGVASAPRGTDEIWHHTVVARIETTTAKPISRYLNRMHGINTYHVISGVTHPSNGRADIRRSMEASRLLWNGE